MGSLMLMIRANVTSVYRNIYVLFVKPICSTHSLRSPALNDVDKLI